MTLRTDTFDLGGLRLTSGEGRRLELHVGVEPLMLGGQEYAVEPALLPAALDVSRTTGGGYALRLRFGATLHGPCMRCLEDAAPSFEVDAREVWQPGESGDLASPYLVDGLLDVAAWTRDALALSLPGSIVCEAACQGLCPVCGRNLREAGADHHHEPTPDPRWAKLSELRLE